ncbi:MAG TPA: hypothetical protein VFH64_03155 [Amnibacterium sp.]|nr:hypothetical protein [Amnibacterium sp.]
MPWIALAAMAWGVVLGATDGPAVGAAVIAAGLALLVLRGAADAHRTRRTRTALIAATAAGRAAPLGIATDPVAPRPSVVLRSPAFREPDELDLLLLNAFWNFGGVDDAAALAGCGIDEAQRRLIELMLEPEAPVAAPAVPDRPLLGSEQRAVLRGWNTGSSLAALSAAFGVSVYGIGGVLLSAGPVPARIPA